MFILYFRKIQIWGQKDFDPIVPAIAVLAPSLNKKKWIKFLIRFFMHNWGISIQIAQPRR